MKKRMNSETYRFVVVLAVGLHIILRTDVLRMTGTTVVDGIGIVLRRCRVFKELRNVVSRVDRLF
jgi:hypothetical protein